MEQHYCIANTGGQLSNAQGIDLTGTNICYDIPLRCVKQHQRFIHQCSWNVRNMSIHTYIQLIHWLQ